MAETFARAGAKVAIVARRPDVLAVSVKEMTAATGGIIKGYPGDVGKAADCQRVVEATVADLGLIDILVNNACDAQKLNLDILSGDAHMIKKYKHTNSKDDTR
jgi:NAD(P)-dependent dehydrogenase (short-subunit alcohol dehydrogenase family)